MGTAISSNQHNLTNDNNDTEQKQPKHEDDKDENKRKDNDDDTNDQIKQSMDSKLVNIFFMNNNINASLRCTSSCTGAALLQWSADKYDSHYEYIRSPESGVHIISIDDHSNHIKSYEAMKKAKMNSNHTLKQMGVTKTAKIFCKEYLWGGGLANLQIYKGFLLINPKPETRYYSLREKLIVESVHVSCQSDAIDYKKNMIGIIIYSYKEQLEWKLNNVRCKAGYIILKCSDNIQHIKTKQKSMHSKCYKAVFNQDPDEAVIAGGFAIKDGILKFNSFTFNHDGGQGLKSNYHDDQKEMSDIEKNVIRFGLANYKFGSYTMLIRQMLCPSYWFGVRAIDIGNRPPPFRCIDSFEKYGYDNVIEFHLNFVYQNDILISLEQTVKEASTILSIKQLLHKEFGFHPKKICFAIW
eukprot:488758_1